VTQTHDARSAADTPVSAAERSKDILLWVAGVVGVAALLFFAATQLLGLTVITFRTGSMSPSLPQGAAALSLPAAASELRVGDIVTVERDGELPITHRIVSIEAADTPERRTIVMQGDANRTPDREPYVVDEVKRVLWGAPQLGTVIATLQTPAVLGTLTLLIAGLIVWGLWPAPSKPGEESA